MYLMLWKLEGWKNLHLVSEQESIEEVISLTSLGISVVKENAFLSAF